MPRASKLPYVQSFPDRHGALRHYFRKTGFPRVPLPGPYMGAEFMAAYEAALASKPLPIGEKSVIVGSINALIVSYYESPDFKNLRSATQGTYRPIIERFRNEHGKKGFAEMQPKHIRQIMNERASTPAAANRLLSIISVLMDHAVKMGMRPDNPAAGIAKISYVSRGHATWGAEDIEKFRAHWPKGSRQRLTLELALGTSQRRGDLSGMGWHNLTGENFDIVQSKTSATAAPALLPDLQEVLSLIPRDQRTFIVNSYGRPYTAASLGNEFRAWCDAAGIARGLTLHGLRKAYCTIGAEAGLTPHEIMAGSGHKTLSEVERYTKEANKKRMALAGRKKLLAARSGGEK